MVEPKRLVISVGNISPLSEKEYKEPLKRREFIGFSSMSVETFKNAVERSIAFQAEQGVTEVHKLNMGLTSFLVNEVMAIDGLDGDEEDWPYPIHVVLEADNSYTIKERSTMD